MMTTSSDTADDAVNALGIARVLNAGFGWLELGLPEEGLQELETLAAESQTLPAALRLRACLLLTLERFPEAAAVAWELLQREPTEPEHILLATHAFERSGNLPAALACLLAVEEFPCGSPEIHVGLARAIATGRG